MNPIYYNFTLFKDIILQPILSLKYYMSTLIALLSIYLHFISDYLSIKLSLILLDLKINPEIVTLIKDNTALIIVFLTLLGVIFQLIVVIKTKTKVNQEILKEGILTNKSKDEADKAKAELERSLILLEQDKIALETKKQENTLNDFLFTLHVYQESLAQLKEMYKSHENMPKEYYAELEKLRIKYNIDKFLKQKF